MIVLLQGPDGCVRPRIAGPAHRLVARLQADRLTRALAAGCPPDASGSCSVRAQALVQPQCRVRSAQTLLETVQTPAAPRADRRRALPLSWDAVRSAQRELLELWRRVLSPGPVTVRGMALVHLLTTDGAGPLYYASCADELRAASNEARAALDLFPPAADAPGQARHA